MLFGRTKRKSKVKKQEDKSRVYYTRLYEPERVYVLTTEIISDHNDGSGSGPIASIQQYYLATKEQDKFYELFSKVELTKEKKFNIPYITKVESILKYVEDTEQILTSDELFEFVAKKNMELMLNLNK